jgi:dehydrogenase/reductase SDR family protein 12
MIVLKILILQLFWFAIVLWGSTQSAVLLILTSLILIAINFWVCSPKISIGRYIFLTFLFTVAGYLHDSSLIWLDIVTKESYSFGFLSLWIIFIAYYGDVFNKLKNLPILALALLGGAGGALAYWSAYKLGALNIIQGKEASYLITTFTLWAAFFPASMWLFYKEAYWDKLLDKSIFFSFDKSGYQRHKNKFTENLSLKNIHSKVSLVTGGTSGIGEAVAQVLSKQGSKVYVTGRSVKKGKAFEEKNAHSQFFSLDMGDWNKFEEFCKSCERFDYIVLNAGSMPENLVLNDFGVESQCASQLLGHYYLINLLNKYGKINSGARIVWVSSGGMYLKQLDLDALFDNKNYEKVSTYANVKRAQVTLVEEMAKQFKWKDFLILSMHPGWVGTEGLRSSLPKFYNIMKHRLRSVSDGADTILWLLLTDLSLESGGFYFDRNKASPYITKKFIPTDAQRALLMKNLSLKFPHE